MAKPQPFTDSIARTSEQSGWSDFQNRTGVTDLTWVHLGWGPAKSVSIQNPFWLPGKLGISGNPYDLLISNANGQSFWELTPGSAKDFSVDRVEMLFVRRLPDSTGADHNPIDVNYWVNYDPPLNRDDVTQYPTVQGGLRITYEEAQKRFLSDMFRTFDQLYKQRPGNK